MFRSLILSLCCLTGLFGHEVAEKPMVVIIPSYKNIDWFEKNLQSIITQNYKNYRIIYLNDSSPDGMDKKIKKWLGRSRVDYQLISFHEIGGIEEVTESFSQMVNKKPSFFTYVCNKTRCGALCNLYRAIYSCSDDEIVVTVDGDDWLSHADVLKDLNEVYSKNTVWLTHGNLIEFPSNVVGWCEPIPKKIVAENRFRQFKCASHLRTFYSWLFKKIKLDDLLYDGKFYAMTWDMAMMYPMLEMCGDRHAFIEKPNYFYNMANQINDNKVDPQLQRDLDKHIRSLPPYKKLP